MKIIQRITQIAILIISTSLFSGCVLFHGYRAPVQQGNVITIAQANRLHNGMSKHQVVAAMGTPVLTNTFSNNRFNYVYTLQVDGYRLHEKKLIVSFANGRVTHIERELNIGMPPKKPF